MLEWFKKRVLWKVRVTILRNKERIRKGKLVHRNMDKVKDKVIHRTELTGNQDFNRIEDQIFKGKELGIRHKEIVYRNLSNQDYRDL